MFVSTPSHHSVVSIIIKIAVINKCGCEKWSNLKTNSFHFDFNFARLKFDVNKDSRLYCTLFNQTYIFTLNFK